MAFFPSTSRPRNLDRSNSSEACPWCEQPISHAKFEDIKRRMALEHDQRLAQLKQQAEREKTEVEARAKAAVEQALAKADRIVERRLAEVRREAALSVEGSMLAKIAETQALLTAAEQARAIAQDQIAAMKDAQDTLLNQRAQEIRETLEKEKTAAVLLEQARAFEERQKLQATMLDLQRKLEGKSANELGEGSELNLFEQLKNAFESDRIHRVGKGVNGADVVHEVIHNGKSCGKIIYDSKNRNAWQNEFATKLRADKLAEGADHAILSSNKFPKDKQQIHHQDGVIIANPARVLAIAEILRGQILRVHELRISAEERGHKTVELYAFITSEHCKQLLETVQAQTIKMCEIDTKEQEAHRRTWDQRAKLIRFVQKARSDLSFEIDRIIGTAGNGPKDEAPPLC